MARLIAESEHHPSTRPRAHAHIEIGYTTSRDAIRSLRPKPLVAPAELIDGRRDAASQLCADTDECREYPARHDVLVHRGSAVIVHAVSVQQTARERPPLYKKRRRAPCHPQVALT